MYQLSCASCSFRGSEDINLLEGDSIEWTCPLCGTYYREHMENGQFEQVEVRAFNSNSVGPWTTRGILPQITNREMATRFPHTERVIQSLGENERRMREMMGMVPPMPTPRYEWTEFREPPVFPDLVRRKKNIIKKPNIPEYMKQEYMQIPEEIRTEMESRLLHISNSIDNAVPEEQKEDLMIAITKEMTEHVFDHAKEKRTSCFVFTEKEWIRIITKVFYAGYDYAQTIKKEEE